MRLPSRVFLLIAVFLLSVVCVRCGESTDQRNNQTADRLISTEQAILVVETISNSAEISEVTANPDLDREIGGRYYYYLQATYENGMSAAYFVDAADGNVFVAVGGELDADHPLPTPAASGAAPEGPAGQGVSFADLTAVIVPAGSAAEKLAAAVGMTGKQIRDTFGEGYKDFTVNYDGYMKAYYYMDEGFIVAFGDDGNARYIYCTDQIDIGGAKAGMNFAQIQALLGSSPVRQTWAETPENVLYEIGYSLGQVKLVFFSRQEDGGHSIPRIG